MKAYQFLDKDLNMIYKGKDTEDLRKGPLRNPQIDVYGFKRDDENSVKKNLAEKVNLERKSMTREIIGFKRNEKYHKFWNYRKFWKKQVRDNASVTGIGIVGGLLLGGASALFNYDISGAAYEAFIHGAKVFAGVQVGVFILDEITRNVGKRKLKDRLNTARTKRSLNNTLLNNIPRAKVNFHIEKDAMKIIGENVLKKNRDHVLNHDINDKLEKAYFEMFVE